MKKNKWNFRLFYWLLYKVFKYPEFRCLTLPVRILRFILLPIDTTYYLMRDSCDCFDLGSGYFTIYGIKYSDNYFKMLSNNGLPLNTVFQIIKREDGVVTIVKVSAKYEHKFLIGYTKEDAEALNNQVKEAELRKENKTNKEDFTAESLIEDLIKELKNKISKLLQEEALLTESEAQDLAHLICDLTEMKYFFLYRKVF